MNKLRLGGRSWHRVSFLFTGALWLPPACQGFGFKCPVLLIFLPSARICLCLFTPDRRADWTRCSRVCSHVFPCFKRCSDIRGSFEAQAAHSSHFLYVCQMDYCPLRRLLADPGPSSRSKHEHRLRAILSLPCSCRDKYLHVSVLQALARSQACMESLRFTVQ